MTHELPVRATSRADLCDLLVPFLDRPRAAKLFCLASPDPAPLIPLCVHPDELVRCDAARGLVRLDVEAPPALFDQVGELALTSLIHGARSPEAIAAGVRAVERLDDRARSWAIGTIAVFSHRTRHPGPIEVLRALRGWEPPDDDLVEVLIGWIWVGFELRPAEVTRLIGAWTRQPPSGAWLRSIVGRSRALREAFLRDPALTAMLGEPLPYWLLVDRLGEDGALVSFLDSVDRGRFPEGSDDWPPDPQVVPELLARPEARGRLAVSLLRRDREQVVAAAEALAREEVWDRLVTTVVRLIGRSPRDRDRPLLERALRAPGATTRRSALSGLHLLGERPDLTDDPDPAVRVVALAARGSPEDLIHRARVGDLEAFADLAAAGVTGLAEPMDRALRWLERREGSEAGALVAAACRLLVRERATGVLLGSCWRMIDEGQARTVAMAIVESLS